MKHSERGFTLIELMVVIVVISVLAGIVTYVSVNVLHVARDAKRKSDLSAISQAFLARYNDKTCYNEINQYPYPTRGGSVTFPSNQTGSSDVIGTIYNVDQDNVVNDNSCDGKTFVPEFMSSIPSDPNSKTPYMFGVGGNSQSNMLVLLANLESPGNNVGPYCYYNAAQGNSAQIDTTNSTCSTGTKLYNYKVITSAGN